MTAEGFRNWRRGLALTQGGAADALGLTKRAVAYYEAGERDGQPVTIPRHVALACAAITAGLEPAA